MKKLLIIETIDNPRASEGKALEKALKLMQDYDDRRTARHLNIQPCQQAYTERAFLKLLGKDVDFLHVSAHGVRAGLEVGRKEKEGKVIKKGVVVTPEKIASKARVKASKILVSACYAGRTELAKAFFSDGREGFYLGPCRNVDFDIAFIVALSFHRGLYDKSMKAGRDIKEKGRILSSGTGTYYYYRSGKDI